jgi:hypothetical protein
MIENISYLMAAHPYLRNLLRLNEFFFGWTID